ncbi:MAG: HNH endonuclease [Sulfobacillus benefaciens]|uniref:HNH endonuclease n=1 Tax=Sulfobacillus benefaciens TaxID=453960 RepID=A0A2T2WMU6_9FIRM|nr:MAG: HNH endonuclease [Sulfobacillus benefaciens]
MNEYPQWFLDGINQINNTRARRVIQHILDHGQVTTEELREIYGYDHPPRGRADVIEHGIPVKSTMVKSSRGRNIAAYSFGDLSTIKRILPTGRRQFPKRLRNAVTQSTGYRCAVCMTSGSLQIDHRIPFLVAGESEAMEVQYFMPLCGSCQRAKSWSCEHCPNLEESNTDTCTTCYWAHPENYKHVATRPMRRMDLEWVDSEVIDYEVLHEQAAETPMPDFVKRILGAYAHQHKPL